MQSVATKIDGTKKLRKNNHVGKRTRTNLNTKYAGGYAGKKGGQTSLSPYYKQEPQSGSHMHKIDPPLSH